MLKVICAMAKREKRLRQTFPGPNSADNQQMLSDIRETLDTHHQKAYVAADRLPPPKDTKRSSPPSELTSSGSPSTTPRMQQNRSTPTKQIASNRMKRHLAKIRRDLKPFAYHSDPGFASQKDRANKGMLEELITLGHSEVNN